MLVTIQTESASVNLTKELTVGEIVRIKCNNSGAILPKACDVYKGVKKIGVLSVSRSVSLPNTSLGAEAYDFLQKNHLNECACRIEKILDTSSGLKSKAIGELLVVEEQEEKIKKENKKLQVITVRVKGNSIKNPAKVKVIKDFKDGIKTYVTIHCNEYDDSMFCMFCGELAGDVDMRETSTTSSCKEIDILKQYLKDNHDKEIIGRVTQVIGQSYILEITMEVGKVKKTKEKMVKNSLESTIKDVLNKGYPKETIDEIIKYLNDNKIPVELIQSLLKSYKEYSQENKERIKKPEILYNDDEKNQLLLEGLVLINNGINIICSGDKGSGKNTYINTISWLLQRPLYSASTNRDTDKYDILGSQTIENGTVTFDKEALIEAMENGGIMNVDEINFADANITALFHSICDDRRYIEVPHYKKVIADKNFIIIATMNYGYEGTNELNDALDDRFFTLDFPPTKSIKDILISNCPNCKLDDISIADTVYQAMYKSVTDVSNDSTLDKSCLTIRGFIHAVKIAKYIPIKKALKDSLLNKIHDYEYKQMIESLIETYVS